MVTVIERTTAPPPAYACARRDAPGTGVCGYALVRERPAAYPPAPCGASVSRCGGYGGVTGICMRSKTYIHPPLMGLLPSRRAGALAAPYPARLTMWLSRCPLRAPCII